MSTDLLVAPGWAALVLASLVVFNKFIEESYKFASFFGPLGRKLHARAAARNQVNLAAEQFAAAVSAAVTKAVTEAREAWEAEDNEALAALDRRLSTVSRVTEAQDENIVELLFQVHCLTAYTEYEGLWHNRFRATAARAQDGRVLLSDLPEHMLYYEFESSYRTNRKWREWITL